MLRDRLCDCCSFFHWRDDWNNRCCEQPTSWIFCLVVALYVLRRGSARNARLSRNNLHFAKVFEGPEVVAKYFQGQLELVLDKWVARSADFNHASAADTHHLNCCVKASNL